VTAVLRAELQRATSRRLVRLVALLALLAAVAVGAITFARTHSGDDAAIAAKVHAAREVDAQHQRAFVACLYRESQPTGGSPRKAAGEECPEPGRGPAVHDPRLYRSRVQDILRGATGILALVAWVIGASLMGAEQQSRATATTLTFAPQRGRVFGAKAAAALVVVAGFAAVTLGLVLLGLLPAALAHAGPAIGEPGNLTIAGTLLRGVGLAAITGMMGFAVASIGRATAASLGVAFGYIVVFENILGSSIAGWRRWLLLGNIIVYVSGNPHSADVAGRSVVGAGIFLAVVAATLLAGSGLLFRTRDVA
jgi:ABC-2 type transport system permease protein